MEVPSPAREGQTVSWVVIGGGVQGTAISISLLGSGVPASQIRVIDPHPAPLAEFARLCTQTGMEFMRSPAEHHLDVESDSLRAYSKELPLVQPMWSTHGNPSCDLWLRHCAWVIRKTGVGALRSMAEVITVRPRNRDFRIETTAGTYHTTNVVVAPGIGYGPNWPWWARALMSRDHPPRIFHAFEQNASSMLAFPATRPLIIGGGITAAQIAIAYAKRWRAGDEPVTMLSYHPIRVSAFDCDTVWMSTSHLADFASEPCFERRRKIVDDSKVRGTVTPEVDAQLQEAITSGALRIQIARIMGAELHSAGSVELKLSDDSTLRSDAVVLATGFAHQHRTSALLEMLYAEIHLPRNSHGDPIISETLTWGRTGLFVAGALAELELGPFASNIIGARWASERIVKALR